MPGSGPSTVVHARRGGVDQAKLWMTGKKHCNSGKEARQMYLKNMVPKYNAKSTQVFRCLPQWSEYNGPSTAANHKNWPCKGQPVLWEHLNSRNWPDTDPWYGSISTAGIGPRLCYGIIISTAEFGLNSVCAVGACQQQELA